MDNTETARDVLDPEPGEAIVIAETIEFVRFGPQHYGVVLDNGTSLGTVGKMRGGWSALAPGGLALREPTRNAGRHRTRAAAAAALKAHAEEPA